ncbi:hypothetical protein [Lysinibacillus piscis]|uniref:Uncharacterized protein n=1 Tax=Lysinibacillus piscis TaxID=2518931 RepID=A0ABQ5NR01_9BACI|nr:hypothetical protein [Lysinibacillus sp. KH24]GLC90558.1 hypothetical protein LYSBPC_36850 [Lysinibacillus sp. KH24]
MNKLLKKYSSIALIGGILFSGFGATTANAASTPYVSPYFDYGVYVGGGDGTDFNLNGTQYFIATHSAVYSGQPSGVIYQLKGLFGVVSTSNSQSGAITQKRVDVSGPTGSRKAYLRNMYELNTPQKASGSFNY